MSNTTEKQQDDPDKLWEMIRERDSQIFELRSELVKFRHYIEITRILNTPSVQATSISSEEQS